MLGAAIVWIGLSAVGSGDFLRPFAEKSFDQAALDGGAFGDKKGMTREAEGLRVAVKPGEAEAGWKTPQALRLGGDCTITATLEIRKLPKPAQEDGAAVGLAVATQNVDQPEVTLLRLVELDGREVFRAINKEGAGPMMNPQMQMMAVRRVGMIGPDANKAPKPERHLFPAKGTKIHFELTRQGSTLRYEVSDDLGKLPREIGKIELGPADIAGVKLFVSNRNGAEPVDVLFREMTIRADRVSGLGTAVQTISGEVIHGDPTAVEGDILIIGGTPPAPTPNPNPANGPAPAAPPGVPSPGTPAGATTTVTVQAQAPAGAPATPYVAAFARTPAAPPTTRNDTGPMTKDAARPATAQAAGPPPTPPKPRAKLPLDVVESITFERQAIPTVRFLGQPNVDVTGPGGDNAQPDAKKGSGDDLSAPPPGTVVPPKMPKVEAKPSGIRDVHLLISGLREAPIRQVMIQAQTEKGQTTYQIDTTGTPARPIAVRRAGNEWWADLFLEPPDGDLDGKPLNITIMYADCQKAQIQAPVKGHTDPKLAFDAKAAAPALDARVFLAGDEQLYGRLESLDEEALTLIVPWGDKVAIPTSRVVAVYMGMSDHKESTESFARRVKSRGTEDTLLARTKDGEVVAIGGVIDGVKENTLGFVYKERTRTLALKDVEGLIFARRSDPKPPAEARPTFSLAGGLVLSGRWLKIGAEKWRVATPWGQEVDLPAQEILSVRVRGGQMAYLSDLEPVEVEETSYFGRRMPYRKDSSLDGGPLKIGRQGFAKGLAVHSRTVLGYDLERKYATFQAVVGFDEAANKKGRVGCRVLADDKEIYANPDLRADGEPLRLNLSVAGAERLRLIVDFGPDGDIGDRVIWGDARIYRRPPPSEMAEADPGRTTPTDRDPKP